MDRDGQGDPITVHKPLSFPPRSKAKGMGLRREVEGEGLISARAEAGQPSDDACGDGDPCGEEPAQGDLREATERERLEHGSDSFTCGRQARGGSA